MFGHSDENHTFHYSGMAIISDAESAISYGNIFDGLKEVGDNLKIKFQPKFMSDGSLGAYSAIN